jgi:hypothetical protein
METNKPERRTASIQKMRNAYKILSEKQNYEIAWLKFRWKDNSKMFLTDNVRFETVDHTLVIGVQDQWRALVRTLMNFRFPYVTEIL